ncbi:hypothetical protein [Deinococcus hopiensis]|uniref:Uncharacterized protein n=1 Tax=Deinococcus hopiensis KR-140 TaxID=695939 RepID=A0A1W1UPF3_9DEIO|nr:hypothetical protein [Deinococcus hopiensis]SMB82972.1 hypothetical protein SAMN00790413_04211 [Deinococcus hopiensis KR-140]
MVFQIICRKTLMATSAIHTVSCLQVKATNLSAHPVWIVDMGVLMGEQPASLIDPSLPWVQFVQRDHVLPGEIGPHATLTLQVSFETLTRLRDVKGTPRPQPLQGFIREQSGQLHLSEPYVEQ